MFSECYQAALRPQKKLFFRICEVQDVNLISCQVYPGEVLPNLGEGEYYPACALTLEYGGLSCDLDSNIGDKTARVKEHYYMADS